MVGRIFVFLDLAFTTRIAVGTTRGYQTRHDMHGGTARGGVGGRRLRPKPSSCEDSVHGRSGYHRVDAITVRCAIGAGGWRRLAGVMASVRTPELGPAARPVAVPDDLDAPSLHKATGRVELPSHIHWSGPPVTYDMADRADRMRVYEQVLREGTEDDVRFYVDAAELAEVFDELVLPPAVRHAWAQRLQHGHCAAERLA